MTFRRPSSARRPSQSQLQSKQSFSCGGVLSSWKPITASIIQGFGIGPSLFVIYISKDLEPLSARSTVVKYADDTTLIVAQDSNVSLECKFTDVLDCSEENKLTFNISKTKQIVFRRPRLSRRIAAPPLPATEQVTCAKVLGVLISHTLSATPHIPAVLTHCTQRLYRLSQLKYHKLSHQTLDIIFNVPIMSKIYALPAFAGQISVADKNKINTFFRKAFRRGLVTLLFGSKTAKVMLIIWTLSWMNLGAHTNIGIIVLYFSRADINQP